MILKHCIQEKSYGFENSYRIIDCLHILLCNKVTKECESCTNESNKGILAGAGQILPRQIFQ